MWLMPDHKKSSASMGQSPNDPVRFELRRSKPITRGNWRSFILQVKHIPWAVNYLSVLRDRSVNAGAVFGIDEFDRLWHRVGIFSAVIQRFEPKTGRPGAGLAGVCPRPAPEIYEWGSAEVLPDALEKRMPHFAFRGLRALFDLSEQRRLDPNATMRDLFGVRLGFADQRLEPRLQVLRWHPVEAVVDLAGVD